MHDASAIITDVVIEDSSASTRGGALYIYYKDRNSAVYLNNTVIRYQLLLFCHDMTDDAKQLLVAQFI